jgi:hypothetical protein
LVILEQKPKTNQLAWFFFLAWFFQFNSVFFSFFRFGSVFSNLARFFSSLARLLISVRFGFSVSGL